MGNIDSVISSSCDFIAENAKCVLKLDENLEALITAHAELKALSEDVIRKVEIAEDQHQLKRLDQVQGWLSRTETLINRTDALIAKGPEQIKKLSILSYTSFKSNLKFGKQIAKMVQEVVDHKNKGVFDRVAEEVPTTPVTERPSEHTVGLESTFNDAWSSLEAENMGIIGLYGMGGVGKTTLMNKINNNLCEASNRFDVVIWIVVSKGFYIGKIQDDIARRIGITDGAWNDLTLDEKALGIFRVLKDMKFVLLLDDVWERVDLLKVGIPLPIQENGSKVVFTTRSVDVCGHMDANKIIPVRCLPEEKAWELFQKKVDAQTLDSSPDIRQLAHEVTKECQGLPLALITIARAMAFKKRVEDWKYALEVLRRSSISVLKDMGEKVYPLLKFSYDSLPDDLQKCLLYCSLFSEDLIISKDKLIDFWIGEGFLDGHGDTSLARNQGHHIIGSLIDACLLEEVDDWSIAMHDVIRDMSLWIARECEEENWKFFVLARYGLTKAPEVGKWGSKLRMSLMENGIENLVEAPNCPHLQTLFLNNNKLKVINNDFFQFMCGLRVLDLSENYDLEELPVGISKLLSLESLDLSDTRIRQLPLELKALEKLKCLRLEDPWQSQIRIPRQLISAFSKLQVLRIKGCHFYLDQEVEDSDEWLVEELKCLNRLDVLTVSITSAFALDRFMSTERLCSCTQSIELAEFEGSKRLNVLSLAKNMKSLNSLLLFNCESLEEVKMEWAGEEEGRTIKAEPESHIQTSVIATQHCFQNLRELWINDCPQLRDITWLILAPNLRFLRVYACHKMEEIINERKLSQVAELVETSSLFAKLEVLDLHYLPELKSIYWDALPFSCLKYIYVNECPKLKRLPLNSNSAKENKIRIKGKEEWWKELQWEDESTLNAFLPCFDPLCWLK